jgi:hypothetical protein
MLSVQQTNHVQEGVQWKQPEKWCTQQQCSGSLSFICAGIAGQYCHDHHPLPTVFPDSSTLCLCLFSRNPSKLALKGKRFHDLNIIQEQSEATPAAFQVKDIHRCSHDGTVSALTVSNCKGTNLHGNSMELHVNAGVTDSRIMPGNFLVMLCTLGTCDSSREISHIKAQILRALQFWLNYSMCELHELAVL